ncbi:phage tail protein [Lewinellaceae bacterium SD302]|nr:phage tail protein [Lewinellaceae bacterium SD302]
MAKTYQTPGVYIEEKSAFPNSVVPVPTATPAFIGYTEIAIRDKKDLTKVPTKIGSYSEFLQFFGAPPLTTFSISADSPDKLVIAERHFTLHSQIKLFFSNGGSECYVVSVGGYETVGEGGSTPGRVKTEDLRAGIEPLLKYPEPSMIVIPEANMADDDDGTVYGLYQDMLKHCGEDTRSRFAIMDVRMDRKKYSTPSYNMGADIDLFRQEIGNNNLQWGAAYFPWLHTSVVTPDEVNILNIHPGSIGKIGSIKDISEEILDDGAIKDRDGFKVAMVDAIDTATLLGLLERALNQEVLDGLVKPARANEIKNELFRQIPAVLKDKDDAKINELDQGLLRNSPTYKKLLTDIRLQLNLLPPSGAMAGIYSMVDNSAGVFQSPANVGVASVVEPAVNINSVEQESLNLPLDGKAVNAIRSFPGKGTLVWGARTLDGNSQDWRYISVRRTVIYIEQSIKNALEPYVFEPNTSSTWSDVQAMIVNFLTNTWQTGALVGASPEDAFSVDVGLGSTMTQTDILNGIMRISAKIAVVRPAEFIVLTFEQQLQQS